MRTFLSIFGIALLVGCTGDLVELTPGQDLAFSQVDMAQGGGGEMGPNTTHFVDIQADLDSKGCTLVACHGTSGNGSVMFVKAMATGADLDTNYTNVMGEVNLTAPDQSPLVRNPLVGSGSGHQGTTPFGSTADPTYQKWLAWITAGAPK